MPGSDSSSELNPDLPGFAQKVKELEEKKKAAAPPMIRQDDVLAMFRELQANVSAIPKLQEEIAYLHKGQEFLMKRAKGKGTLEEEDHEPLPSSTAQVSVPNPSQFSPQDV